MSTIDEEVPFLFEQADRVSYDQKPDESQSKTADEVGVNWFHTRCGHPRARDD